MASWWALLPWAQVSALVCVFLVAVPWPPGEFFPFGPQSVCLQPSQHRLPHSPHLSSFPASSLLLPLPLFPPPPSTSERLRLPFPPAPAPHLLLLSDPSRKGVLRGALTTGASPSVLFRAACHLGEAAAQGVSPAGRNRWNLLPGLGRGGGGGEGGGDKPWSPGKWTSCPTSAYPGRGGGGTREPRVHRGDGGRGRACAAGAAGRGQTLSLGRVPGEEGRACGGGGAGNRGPGGQGCLDWEARDPH